jgi:hypothetical protein
MSAKWKERKEALEGLLTLIDHPKLEDGKYYELINVLAKKIQDPNVVVLVLAAGCLEKLALGLRDSFGQYRNIVLEPLLERMKEKKTNVVAALRNALDALFESIRKLSDISEDIIVYVTHSNPSIRQETLEFVTRAFNSKKAVKDLPKGDLKKFMECLTKSIDDSIPAVREAGVVCLANAMVLYGEKVVCIYTDRLDKLKLQKVMDCYNTIKDGKTKVTPLVKKVVKTPTPVLSPVLKKAVPKAAPKQVKKSTVSKSIVESGLIVEDYEEEDDEGVAVSFIDKLPKNFFTDIVSTKWKERKETLEELLTVIDHPKLEDGKYHELINILAKKIQDPNVVVLVLALGCLEKLALGLQKSFGMYKNIVLEPLLERMKEKKTNVVIALRKTLDALFTSIKKISDIQEDVLVYIAHSNPSVRQETLDFLTRVFNNPKLVKDGQKSELKKFIDVLVKSLDDSIPAVRDSGAICVGNAMAVYGEKVVCLDKLDKVKSSKVMDAYHSVKLLEVKTAVVPKVKVVQQLNKAVKQEVVEFVEEVVEEDQDQEPVVDDGEPLMFIGKLAKNFYTDIVFFG